MSAVLTKVTDATQTAEFASWLEVRCPICKQPYRLVYSDEEWNLRTWQQLAEEALWKDHGLRHQAATIPLEWSGIRRR